MLKQIKNFWKPLAVITFWGFSFIATKYVLSEINPLSIVFLRQIFGFILLFFILIKQGKSFVVNPKDLKWVLVLAVIAWLHLWIQVTGLQWTTASNTGWIIGITPVFMTILGLIFFKEKLTGMQIFGIAAAFFGLMLLVSKGDLSSIDFISNRGDLLIVGSTLTWAAYSLVSKKITLKYSPVVTTLYLFLFVAVITAPLAISKQSLNAVINLSFVGWISILFLGFFCSGVAYVLWAKALSEMNASKVGAFLYIQPFITFFGSWLYLDEEITIITLLSGIIIIGGVVLVNRK